MFVQCDNVVAGLYVTQYSEHLHVLMIKNVSAGPVSSPAAAERHDQVKFEFVFVLNVHSSYHDHSKLSGKVNGRAFDSHMHQVLGAVTGSCHCVSTPVVIDVPTQSPSSALTGVPGPVTTLCHAVC